MLLVKAEEEGDILGVWDSGPGSQAREHAIADREISDILPGGSGHDQHDLLALTVVVPSVDSSGDCDVLSPPQPFRPITMQS